MKQPAFELADFQAAYDRMKGYVRRTPLVAAAPLKSPPGQVKQLSLKLECLQVSGSFKARGAISKLFTLAEAELARGIITASGGNHGLAVAYAGWLSGTPATIYLPYNTPPIKAQKLADWGATVVMEGDVWDDANHAALAVAEQQGLTYIHPFADAAVIAGQGTIALEVLEQGPEIDVLLAAIGGGGLISGLSRAAKLLKPDLRVIGVEPVGAPTLYESVRAGKLVELPAITTRANTLAPRRSEAINLDLISRHVEQIVLVDDEQMRQAARWLWFEFGVAAELSGAAAMAPLLAGLVEIDPSEHVCVLVCGAGTDGIDLV